MADPTLKIKRRGDDGYKVISVRIKEETLEALDKLAAETNYSRNELINLLLRHGVEHVEGNGGTVLFVPQICLGKQKDRSSLGGLRAPQGNEAGVSPVSCRRSRSELSSSSETSRNPAPRGSCND